MTPIVHEVPRTLRAGGPRPIHAGRRREIFESLRWMQREHVRDLCRLGYSAQEAFWLDFACLPFLPWDGTAAGEMPLTSVLQLYADIYRHALGSAGPWDQQAFVELLRRRYHRMRQVVVAANKTPPNAGPNGAPQGTPGAPEKSALGGLIVLQTARAWQAHHAAFPCRLLENL
jgi:hypothetical protein